MDFTKSVEKLENSQVKLSVTVPGAECESQYNKKVQNYVKTIQLPGFRRGHVPAAVIERKFADGLRAEVAADLIDDALNQIFSEEASEQIRPLAYSQPQVEGGIPPLKAGEDYSFTVTYDVFPEVKVTNLDGIEIKLPEVSVTASDIDRELRTYQERNAVITDRPEGEGAEAGDIVTLDYHVGDGSDESQKRTDFVYTLGSNSNVYKFDQDIVGIKKGETKTVEKTYGDDDEHFKGQTKTITITVKQIKRRELPALDDNLAQDVSERFKTLDDLKADIKSRLERDLAQKLDEIKERAMVDALIERNPVTLPRSMIQAERDARLRATAERFGMKSEDLMRNLFGDTPPTKDQLKSATGDVERTLKARLILDSLIQSRNITVQNEDLEKEYADIAKRSGTTVDKVKENYKEGNATGYLEESIRDRKLFDELYTSAKISKGENISFEDLFRNYA